MIKISGYSDIPMIKLIIITWYMIYVIFLNQRFLLLFYQIP